MNPPPSVCSNRERKSPQRGLGRPLERWRYQCNFPKLTSASTQKRRNTPRFRTLLFGKETVKTFFYKCSNSGRNESTQQTQNNVSWISSKADLKILFLNSRLEMWVWKSGAKIDPATGMRNRDFSLEQIWSCDRRQDFTTPQHSFEFSEFYYTWNSFLMKPINANNWKTRPFREILSERKGRGEDRVE